MKNSNEITTQFKDNVYPLIEKSLSTPSKLSAYKRCLGRFIELRSKELEDTVPCSRTYFGAKEIDDFFNSVDLDKKVVTNAINNTYYKDIPAFNPKAARDEFTVAVMMVIRYFYLKQMPKELEISCIYLAFSGKFYPSIHSGKFLYNSDGKYNRHVMEYVVNNELSGKFDLKREKSVLGAVKSICRTWVGSYGERFKKMDDEDTVYLIQQLHNRIKSFLGNIASVYYDVIENKQAYLAYTDDDLSEENYHTDTNSDSLRCEKYVEAAMAKINGQSVDQRLCAAAANANVKLNEVKSIIESIIMDNANLPEIKELVRLLITNFINTEKGKSVTDIAFITKSITPKPNTKDKNILRQKEIVEKWLSENSPAYRKRKSREATRVSYHKSVIAYFTFVIYYANK